MTSLDTDPAENRANELFVAWSCLAILMVIARERILIAGSWSLAYLPIAVYQDIALAAALCWLTLILLAITRSVARRLIVAVAWMLCLAIAAYTTANAVIFTFVKTPLDYRTLIVWHAADLRDFRTYIRYALTPAALVKLIAAPILLIAIAQSARRFGGRLLRRARRIFASPATLAILLVYFFVGSAWSWISAPDSAIASNAEIHLARSFFADWSVRMRDDFPTEHANDFQPGAEPAEETPMTGRAGQRSNIVMVVMESVGASRLQLCGAPYHDSPELVRLSQHAATFSRMYASMPWSSSAMTGLFCSLYPYLGLRSVTFESPDLPVTGIATALAAHGYKTAFIHAGPLGWDREAAFLRYHGFEVRADPEAPGPRDQVMLNEGVDWIARNRAAPFLLVLWTRDTHTPYASAAHADFEVKDAGLGRYLNAIASTDALIGELAAKLDAMSLADRTLLVIIGDHGEAFGEHGHSYHGSTVYDEQVRIPLMLVNRRLFPNPVTIDLPAQQVDLAPTLMDLLGYPAPAQWQGRSVFALNRSGRQYLFAEMGSFHLGMIDGGLKYIYDYDQGRNELYDLNADRGEQRNIADDPRYASFIRQARRRLSAWVAFQNPYYDRLSKDAANR
ncbi:MAG: sulfatase [Candidatus Binatales bacterium]